MNLKGKSSEEYDNKEYDDKKRWCSFWSSFVNLMPRRSLSNKSIEYAYGSAFPYGATISTYPKFGI